MSNYRKFGYAHETWNPLTGCTKGCPYCWARPMAYGLKGRYGYDKVDPFKPTFHADRLDEISKYRKPRIFAFGFMGDWMEHGDHTLAKVRYTMINNQNHTFLTLTKNPKRLLEYTKRVEFFPVKFVWSENIYNGLTITNQADADEKLPIFLQIPGKKWLSIEPMVGPIDLMKHDWIGDNNREVLLSHISQVILGGMTGPKATPLHPDWVRQVRDDCEAAGVPFMFKQWGEWGPEIPGEAEISKLINFNTDDWGDEYRYLKHSKNYEPDIKRGLPWDGDAWPGDVFLYKHGKQAAGRPLDGREHNDLAWGRD